MFDKNYTVSGPPETQCFFLFSCCSIFNDQSAHKVVSFSIIHHPSQIVKGVFKLFLDFFVFSTFHKKIPYFSYYICAKRCYNNNRVKGNEPERVDSLGLDNIDFKIIQEIKFLCLRTK